MSTRLPRWRRMLVVAAATLTSVTAATAAAALEPGGATDAPPPTTEAPQPPAPDTEVPAVPIDDVEVTAPPVVDDPEIAPEIAPDDEVTAPEAGPVPADDPDPADDPAPAATVPTTAPAASPASHEGGATFLVNGQPFHGQDDPKLDGCTITLSITEADDASHQATGAIRAVEPSGAATLVSFDEAFEGTSWSQSWPLDALVGDLEQKPNGYRIQIDLELDDEGQQTSRRFWLACGADQEGNPYVVVLDKQWQAPDGTVLDGPPADLPEDWRLTATSKLGTATCTYPPGSTELVCTYENKGEHAGSTEGLYVPGGEKHTYLVSESGLPDGWTAVEGIGEFSARARCPRGDDDHEEHVASGEGGGTVCPHLVVNRQAPPPTTTTTTTTLLPSDTTAPVAVSPATTDQVAGGATTPTGTLARTGDDSTGPALVGLALIVLGTAVLALRRRALRSTPSIR